MTFPHPNVSKLLWLAFFQAFTLYAAFEKVFFQESGLSIIQIFLVTVVFSVTVVALEVPSGALSDRWVRKHVLTLSIIFSMLTALVYVTSVSFWMFALGSFFMACSFVLNSGTNTAILFDSLKDVDKTDVFEKYLATRRIISGAGFAIASLVGGYIAQQQGISMAIWISLFLLFPAVVLTLVLKEPSFHKTTGELSYWKHIKYTATHLSGQKYFVQVAALSVVIMTVNILIEDYAQLYYYFAGFSLFAIGILSFFEGVKEMVGNYIGSRVSQTRRTAYMYGYLLVVMSGALLLTAWQVNILGVLGLFITSIIFFIIDVPLLGSFHRKLDSKIRATSESFLNLVTELTKVLIAFGFVFIANEYSINIAFGVLGVLVFLYTIYYFLFSLQVIRDS
jgi:MFS family permease